MTSGGMEAKTKGKEWRVKMLNGVGSITFPGCLCGVILIFGEKSHPIVVNKRGQVLCAAAELGKGRVVVFSHDMFVDSFIENNTKHQNKRFSDYIRTWVSKGRDKGSEIPSYENYQNDFDSLPPECKILAWNGMSFPNEQCLYQLTDWIERGGGFICGVCPSKFVYINNIEIEDMPLNYIFRKIDVVYAGSETYICDNDETFIREIDTDCVKLQDVISMAKMNPEKCVKLSNMVLHLPGQVYDLYKPDIIDILQKLGQGDHYIPSVELPVNSINGKKAAILKCNLMIRDGLDGNLVTAEGIEEFPGTFSETPELQSIQMVFTSVGSKIHSTGYYLPAGFLIEISWNNTNKPWIIRIGLHKADLSNVTSGFRRWPKIAIRKVMKSSPIQICSPFGGLVYLESPNEINDKIVCKIDNVVPAPTFTFKTASKWELFERSKPGLWCDIIGDKITFTLPSSSIRSLPDPTKTMKLWDSIVGAHIKLRGKDTSNGIGEWVITDEQLHIDDAYMVSGYPIVIHLDMADPNKIHDDCFPLNGEIIQAKGAWGLFQEIGHNFQDDMWTWEGTREVTANIFTLHAMDVICNIKPWSHPWIREQFDKSQDYLKAGAKYTEWCQDAGIGLMLYAQLARDFGWNAYKATFNIYDKLPDECRPKTQKEKENMWMVTFSKVVKRNLCPFFEFWGWQITSIALEELQTFPPYLPNDETTSAFAKGRTAQIAKKYCFEFPRSESSTKSVFKNKDNSSKNMTTNTIGYTTTPHYSRRSNDLSLYKTNKMTSRNAECQSKSKSSEICSVL